MTDLHCHILPAIDDGAKNAKVSMELLRMQNDAGITDIVCTPHFNPDSQNLEDFIDKRYRSARYLADYVFRSELPVRLKFGAEVRISPTILDLDFLPLCFQKTKVMLLEMPRTLRPQWDTNIIYQLTLGGVIPLIAHIERYPYVQKNPNIALDWIEAGAYLQVNADSIVGDTTLIPWTTLLFLAIMMSAFSKVPSMQSRPVTSAVVCRAMRSFGWQTIMQRRR